MKKNTSILAFALTVSISFISCEKEKPDPETKRPEKCAYIVNEGGFNTNTAEITQYNKQTKEAKNDYFNLVNSKTLGDIAQSMHLSHAKELGFIVVNNSQKIEIVNLNDFKSVGKITGLSYPRYCMTADNDTTRLFITNGNGVANNYVYIADIRTRTLTDSIKVGKGPERLIKLDDKLFVLNSGGYDNDSTISVIDFYNEKVISTITVKDKPIDICKGFSYSFWVFCKGKTEYDENWNPINKTNSFLVQVDYFGNYVIGSVDLGFQIDCNGSNVMASNENGIVYFIHKGICKYDFFNETIDTNFIAGNFYGIDIDPETGYIWASETASAGNGKMHIFKPDGTKVESFETGQYPTQTVFYIKESEDIE
ncbi:MAG: hypothetical protein IPO21_21350 [Bacteroidales bacterium]|nr:hypothetical protein [Bacteroidales bacterium]